MGCSRMKLFLEIEEIAEAPLIGQSIRVEVRNEEEAEQVLEQLRQFFTGKKYIAKLHYCYHEEGKPCEIKVIEEVR